MDLGAYMAINDLCGIAEANGIRVPRLRGYRLMVNEYPVSEADLNGILFGYEMQIYEDACCSVPPLHPNSDTSEFSPRTDRIKKKYLYQREMTDTRPDGTEYSYKNTYGFHWERLHGKARKRLKLAIKQGEKRVRKQFETFNKYVGRDDVLYIHARIGGPNWFSYDGKDLEKQPWFIEKVDDYFDCTYCDIYARIDPSLGGVIDGISDET